MKRLHCAHDSMCPSSLYMPSKRRIVLFVLTSLCVHTSILLYSKQDVNLCSHVYMPHNTSLCAHVLKCPKSRLFVVSCFFVPTFICDHVPFTMNISLASGQMVKASSGQAMGNLTSGQENGQLDQLSRKDQLNQ